MSLRPSRRRVLSVVPGLAAVVAAPAPAVAVPAGRERFVVRDARIFDGHRVTECGSVLVVDGRIIPGPLRRC